jgi:MFS family permease
MCVIVAVNQLGFGAMIPALPLYAQSFGVPHSAIGGAIAVYGLARFLVAMPTGQLADSLGRRPTLALGGVVSAVGNLWSATAAGFPEFLVARFVAGAGATLVLTTGVVILADITTPARRGRVMAIYQGVFLFAVGIGPFPGGLIAEHAGLAAPFVAYAAAAAFVGGLAWFAVPETRDLHRPEHAARDSLDLSFPAQLRLLGAQVGFLLVSAIGFMHAVARTGGIFNIIPVLGRDALDLSASAIGLSMAIGGLLGLAVTYPAGMLVDWYGRKAVIVPATAVTALALVLFALAPSYAWFIAASAAWGVASAVGGAAPSAYAADSAPPGMNAAAMSSFRMLADLGYVIGPITLGWIVDVQGPQAALGVAAFLLVVNGALFARFAPETYRGRKSGGRARS